MCENKKKWEVDPLNLGAMQVEHLNKRGRKQDDFLQKKQAEEKYRRKIEK